MNDEAAKQEAVDLGVKLSQLPHDDYRVIAARLAMEIRADRMQSNDDYAGGLYHRIHELPEKYSELQKQRYPPNGDRDEWVRSREGDFPGLQRIPEQRQPTEWTPAPAEDTGAARVRGR
jgi:hypothetical protein